MLFTQRSDHRRSPLLEHGALPDGALSVGAPSDGALPDGSPPDGDLFQMELFQYISGLKELFSIYYGSQESSC